MIGLDFGTTNSSVYFTDELGNVRSVSVATGPQPPYDRVLPSVVLDPEGDGSAVGREAEQAHKEHPDQLRLARFKPYLDDQQLKIRHQVTDWVTTREYSPTEQGAEVKPVTKEIEEGGRYSREELVQATARILEHLLVRAFEEGADREATLWLSTPVRFSGYARKRLLCALSYARDPDGKKLFDGFCDLMERVHFILEPVAAAAAPGTDLEVRGEETVLIFDHGGGTLDMSLISFRDDTESSRPVPVRELAGGGLRDVGGSSIDDAFMSLLRQRPETSAYLDQFDYDVDRRQAIERCKMDLSTATEARLLVSDIWIERQQFERAIQPLLVRLAREVERTVTSAGRQPGEVDWVFMTGGASLVPAVQERVLSLFPRVAAEDRVLRYFPDDTDPGGGVESALTDVARGLAGFGHHNELERSVLWDLEIWRDDRRDFSVVIPGGTPFDTDEQGQPFLTRRIPLDPAMCSSGALGVYENQLTRRFVFGLAELPELENSCSLEVLVSPEALLPEIRIVRPDGETLRRPHAFGWEADLWVEGTLPKLPENHLADFFHVDAEYLPAVGFRKFGSAPLTRPIAPGDYVEWCERGATGASHARHRGRVVEIRKVGSDPGPVDRTGWDLSECELLINDSDRKASVRLVPRGVCLRLSPNPGKDFI